MSQTSGPPSSTAVFTDGLWRNHAIFSMVLGICSALAVTTLVKNAFVMYLGVLFATAMTSLLVSLLRHRIPGTFRMMVYMLLASTLVIVFDRVLKMTLPGVSKELGPYVGLIITNCIVMGRAEAYAINNPPWPAFLDACGAATGYGLALLLVAMIRESIGMGTLLGWPVMPDGYPRCGFLIAAPGAFVCLAMLIMLSNALRARWSGSR